jgi:hypothetical protein
MNSFRLDSVVSIAATCAVCLVLAAAAPAQEFRVDTELFENQEKQPSLQTLTIFTDGAAGTIYDFLLTEPREVIVYDPLRGRFTLLDESRQVKATVTTDELFQVIVGLQAHAAKEKNALLAFCAEPHFEITERKIDQGGPAQVELKLAGKPLTYVAVGQRPQRPEAARAYRHFADWCARLNVTRGYLPPGARLELNKALAERELMPLDITLTFPPTSPWGKKKELRSEHRVNWSLSGEDRKKIAKAGEMLATYAVVSYEDYKSGGSKPPANKQARK